jgi:outer membrane protein insertion porin family
VVIDVNVVEQPTGSLSFGANYSSDQGPALLASFAEDNFLGRGQQVSFELSFGQDNRVLSFDFTEPQFLGRDLELGLDLSYRQTDNADALYDTDSFRFAPSLGFPASEIGRLSVFYALESNDLNDVSSEASAIIQREAAEEGNLTNGLGYSFSFDTRRNNIDTPTNYNLRFGQEYAVGEGRSFVQSTALASAETAVLGEEVTLRATLEGGYLHFLEGSSRVTDRFFLGSRVMRGFERGGIGPRDAETDDALGGNAYAVLRLETEFPLPVPDEYGIAGGAFVDYGSVWEVGNTDPIGTTDDPDGTGVLYDDYTPRATAGLSLFWNTPLGPLRFNFTRPIIAEDRDETQNFDVTVSTRF